MVPHRRTLLAVGLATPKLALSQINWPSRPVRLLIPFPPGSGVDTLSRLVAERLSDKLGQTIQPDNRPGASGNIAMEALARSPADGYTLGIAITGVWLINPFLFARLPYDADRDLVPIAPAWTQTNAMVVAPEHCPARTMAEFLAWARERRGRLNYGHIGVGTTPHLCSEWFNQRMDLGATAVPFRGGAEILTALLRGDVQFSFDNLASFAPLLGEGRIHAVAVTSEERWPTFPEIPTMAEGGVPGFSVSTFATLAAPAGTPAAVVGRCNAAIREAYDDPVTQRRFLSAGARTLWSTPEDVSARIRRERPMWQEMVRISGARTD